MFPDNPFLQLTLPRASSIFSRIQAAIWSEIAEVDCHYAGAFASPKLIQDAQRLDYNPVKLPFHWGNLFDQGWFKLKIPSVLTDAPVYLHWQDEGEGTVYINGVPYYGFDVAHRYCRIPENAREVFIEGLCLQSAIWHPDATGLSPQGSKLTRACLCQRNDLAWEVNHDLRALYDLAVEEAKACDPCKPPKTTGTGYQPPVETVSVLYRRLLRALDDTFNALDSGGLPAAQKLLKESYARLKGQHERITAVLTGHAHIDLVWLWPEKNGIYKAMHTFSTMNRLMDVYPELVFGYSQPASYDAVAERSPELIEQVKGRIQSGRWEAVGAVDVESDTLLPCGEALLRSFLLGQKGYLRLQGKPSPVLWLPDVFGYCGCLPQIMRQTGVEYFFTTKLTWSNINLFPYSSFVWRGTDGSDVIVHVTQENGYTQTASAEELRRGARAYRQSDIHDEFLAPTGFGDGGGGVTEEMCERARRYQSLSGLPEVRWGRVDHFFENLNKVREKLPTYQGELYLEFHRGVLTTHGDLKARFRECERAFQTWEAVRSVTHGGEVEDQSWRRLVFAQFHDFIPGSSIWEVYEEGLPELAGLSKKALTSAAQELGNGGTPALFNPLPVERTVIVDGNAGESAKVVRLAPLSGTPVHELPCGFHPAKGRVPTRPDSKRIRFRIV